jgi:AcrR family transcriptional regulator
MSTSRLVCYSLEMAYDSGATRARLLDAAYAEFSERGLAGARVERIAAVAEANKQAIYAYFGSKAGLFDAMLSARLGILSDTVPFTPDDLPGYAGALFDALTDSPELVRLTQWKWLERTDPSPAEVASHRDKANALRAATGLSSESAAMDVLILVIAVSSAWSTTAAAHQAIDGPDAEPARQRRLEHRAAVVASVAAIAETLPRAAAH